MTTSTLAWPWVLAVGLLAAVATGAWARRSRRRRPDPDRWVAHTVYLEQIPAWRRAMARQRWFRGGAAVLLAVGVVSAAVLAARPVDRQVIHERLGTRDIVLCLDVSGSMIPFDSAIVATFAALVDGFSGERIALSVFDSTSRTVFPLTDDYTLVLEELEVARAATDLDVLDLDGTSDEDVDRLLAFLAGTYGVPDAASLIGDGLATCALQFDEQETERARSIILATDNYVNGDPIYTLPQAVDLVAARQVQIFALYPDELRGSPENQELAEVIAAAGGTTWFADDPAAVDALIEDITAAQAVALGDDPEIRLTDRPHPWFGLLAVAVAGLLVLRWRTRS